MTILNDWMADAASEIALGDGPLIIKDSNTEKILEIIAKHCPFKPDVAYMEAMEHIEFALKVLAQYGADIQCGACMEVAFTGVTTNTHTCKASQPTLLQCATCRNTESPAGALARQFNHGRCLHCGGYFHVLRA